MKYTIKRKMLVEQEITFETNIKLSDTTISNLVNGDIDVFDVNGFGKYNEYTNTDEMEFKELLDITDENGNILY